MKPNRTDSPEPGAGAGEREEDGKGTSTAPGPTSPGPTSPATATTATATAAERAGGADADGDPVDEAHATPAGADEEPEAAHDPESAPWTGRGAWVFPSLVAFFGVIALWGAFTIEAPPNSAPPGPGVVPGVIGALLLLVAAKMAFDNLRVARALREGVSFGPPAPPTEWSPVALTIGALAVHVALLEPLGWLLAGTLLFWGVSYAFGAREPLRDAVVSLSMSAVVQVGFSFGLGLNLPGGVLELVL
ncbi:MULTISPECIES: tripartite tricarboxylate transporter TctB family protein [unclassified Streptomyces]|uniref:tripartite tricarboxylate transporter TctB family protein n=1 Tax=unclassified Streptomyces TaxID=2593676 RepID=UPI0015E17908|nr:MULTISPECIES: tripartite tricarboxylate transporter TctB family protein [unclassified Streptomyces]